jgi:transposase
MRVKTRQFTPDFRADAIDLYRRTDRSVRAVAADLGVNHHTLTYWIRQDSMKRSKPASTSRSPSPRVETSEQKVTRLERENKRLERENEQLKMDREILKKAAAFFAKESE